MADDHRDTCHVFVGDPLPDASLADLDGDQQSLTENYGQRATIVLLWRVDNPYAKAALTDVAERLSDQLATDDVTLVTINVGDSVEEVQPIVDGVETDALFLLDPDKDYFHTLATSLLPRTYVLDADGTIRWLDVEYSRTTLRHLRAAIEVLLSEPSAASRS